jgi:hypothetical protein
MKKPFHAAIDAIKKYHKYENTPPTVLIYMLDDGTPGVKISSNIPDNMIIGLLEELIKSKKKSPD